MIDRDLHADFGGRLGGYTLGPHLGHGGMAEVYEATGPGGGKVAVKRLLPRFSNSTEFTQMFMAEAELAWQLRHPNILRVHHYGRDQGHLYMALELVQGIDLLRLGWSVRKAGQTLPLWFPVYAAREVARALVYAHDFTDRTGQRRSVIHRDISPDNVFITETGEVKLGDFGIAYDPKRDNRGESPLMGKLPYLAPEAIDGQAPAPSNDLFSLAVVLWELISLRPLFRAPSSQELMARICSQTRPAASVVNPEVPSVLDGLLAETLDPDPRRRPTGEVFAARLDGVLSYLRPPVLPGELADLIQPHLGARHRPQRDLDEASPLPVDTPAPAPARSRVSGRTGYAFIRNRGASAPANPATHLSSPPSAEPRPTMPSEGIPRPSGIPTPPAFPRPAALDPDRAPPSPPTPPTLSRPSGLPQPAAAGPRARPRKDPNGFLLHAQRGRAGPMPADLLFRRLVEMDSPTLLTMAVSCPDGPQSAIQTLLTRMDEALVPPELPSFSWSDRAESAGFAPIFCRLAERAQDGVLVIFRPGQRERVDIHFAGGKLTAARSNRALLSDCADEAARPDSPLPAALRAWLTGQPPPPAAAQTLSAIRKTRLRRLLDEALRWQDAQIGFSPGSVDDTPDAPTLRRLLPYLVARASNREQLRALLGARLHKPTQQRADFELQLTALQLDPDLTQLARGWGQGRSVADDIARAGEALSEKEGLLIAYLLWELKLLRPTG